MARNSPWPDLALSGLLGNRPRRGRVRAITVCALKHDVQDNNLTSATLAPSEEVALGETAPFFSRDDLSPLPDSSWLPPKEGIRLQRRRVLPPISPVASSLR